LKDAETHHAMLQAANIRGNIQFNNSVISATEKAPGGVPVAKGQQTHAKTLGFLMSSISIINAA